MAILESVGLTKAFGEFMAVNDVSLKFEERQLAAIIGPNGAGKSTYFNLLSGRYKPTSGTLYFKTENITGLPPFKILRRGIGRSFQITNIFPALSAFENLRIGILAYTGQGRKIVTCVDKLEDVNQQTKESLKVVGLEHVGDLVAGALSYGDQRRLEIGLTLTCQPNVLLLDEPTAGMTPEETKSLTNLIQDIARQSGLTVILTEHDMGVVFSIAERIIVMQQGGVIADGTKEEIRADPIVREAYLGGEDEC
jgi:branched-chain amino acid transport system ATP-binding protein